MSPHLLIRVPKEIQHNILEMMDGQSLARLSRTSKQFSAIATPFLWGTIDFVAVKRDEWLDHDELIVAQSRFFRTCDRIIDATPQRWEELASLVRILRLVRVSGLAIPEDIPNNESHEWIFQFWRESKARSILDIVAYFRNLTVFHFFLKNPIDSGILSTKRTAKIKDAVGNLKELEIGGELGDALVLNLLSHPENIEKLTCTGLRDGDVGQNYFSAGVPILSDIAHRFLRLKQLHLTKLALRTERPYDAEDEDIWNWDEVPDIELLSDWAGLLIQIAPTLVELTLGNFYTALREPYEVSVDFKEEDFEGEPTEWCFDGKGSSRRFRDIILPALAKQTWPKLERLVFTGIHLNRKVLEDAGVWEQLIANPRVEIMAGEVVAYDHEATPLCISPPAGSFQVHGGFTKRTHITISDHDDDNDSEDDGSCDDNSGSNRDDEENGQDNEDAIAA